MTPSSDRQARFLTRLEAHRRIVHAVAGNYARGAADREDLAQEIVVQLWRSFDRYDEGLPFSTWTYRVALNVAISFSRGQTRRASRFVAAEEPVLELVADPRPDPAVEADDERLALLRRWIAGLDELDRALVLLYLDDLSHETIGQILGISTSNVGTKIHRLKSRLRRDLATA